MKRCVFQELLMLSLKERRAKSVSFHPQVTLIRGTNDTGKSSLMKTLYRTFGATPSNLHPKWKDADVRSLVRFTLDDIPYAMLKTGDTYCVFDGTGNRLISAKSITRELAPFIADLFNFRLQLQSRTEQTQATPAFLFLPFYVDQDAGWNKNWSSFIQLAQFTNWRKDVADYHMGVRPNEYYQAKSGLARVREDLRVLRERRGLLQRVLDDLKAKVSRLNFDTNFDNYKEEVERLLVACNRLQRRESELKASLSRLYNSRFVFESQLSITSAAAKELSFDYHYAVEKIPDELECPTCGTLHRNSFFERFSIARDEARCRELEDELRTEIAKVDTEVESVNRRYSEIRAELEETQQLLTARQGDVTLQQLIENEGRRNARSLVEDEINAVDSEIGRANSGILTLERRMALYENQERRFTIRTQYVNRMRRFVASLGVLNLNEKQYSRLDCSIQETGSDLPRGLLAYYYAVLQTIADNDSATYCPIVIDSPRQQDQDDVNWTGILEFLRDNQPKGSQLILGLRENDEVKFDGKTIDLTEKFQILSADEYNKIFNKMMPYIEAAYRDEGDGSLFS